MKFIMKKKKLIMKKKKCILKNEVYYEEEEVFYMKKKKYLYMKVYIYERYVSRITYVNSDIVEESIYEISVYTYVI